MEIPIASSEALREDRPADFVKGVKARGVVRSFNRTVNYVAVVKGNTGSASLFPKYIKI